MYCPKCGSLTDDDDLFCRKCGNSLAGSPAPGPKTDDEAPVQTPAGDEPAAGGLQPGIAEAPEPLAHPLPVSTSATGPRETGPAPKKSRTGMVLGIVFGCIGFVILALVVYFGLIQPAFEPHSSSKPRATISAAAAKSPKPSPTPTVLSDKQFISYFTHVACYSEYGNADQGYVKRWEQNVKVQLHGNYTDEDYAILKGYIDKLNDIQGVPQISIVKSGANCNVYFVKQSEIGKYVDGYVSGNRGYTYMYWNSKKQLTKVQVGIATDTTQEYRRYLILHEFTHAMGPLNDSPVKASILDGSKQELGEMDWRAIEFLYSKFCDAGMSQSRVEKALDGWLFLN